MPVDRTIAEQFYEAVKSSPLSSTTIAEAAGCTRQQIDFVRSRVRKPRIDLAERIAKAIGFRLVFEPIISPSKKRAARKRVKRVDKAKKSG